MKSLLSQKVTYISVLISIHTHMCINTDTYLEKNSSSLPSPAKQSHIMRSSINEFPYLATTCLLERISTDTKKRKNGGEVGRRTEGGGEIIKY